MKDTNLINKINFVCIFVRTTINSMNKIKELNKWRDITFSWVGRISIVKMSVFPYLIYTFNANLIKIPASYFMDIYFLFPKKWCGNRFSIVDNIEWDEQIWRRDTTWPQDCEAMVIKIVQYWRGNRQVDQWNKIESAGIDPLKYSQMTFDIGAQWSKIMCFQQMVL